MMMNKLRLGDIANVDISGIDKKTKEGETTVRLCNFTDVYYNWAITKNMYDGLMEASASENDIQSFLLHKGMVAITKDSETRDDIGIATYIADDFTDVVLGYHCALITPKEDNPEDERIYGKYLNAFLHTQYAQEYFSNNATGSGQRYTLSKEAIEDMPVLLPSFNDQKKIGDYLSDLDRKIEISLLVKDQLIKMAKQVFDYWFVQFDFPNESRRPYRLSGGSMVWNATLKREIPEGWEVCPMSEKVTKKSGDWGQDYEQPDYSMVVNCIRGADFKDPYNAPVRYINKDSESLLEEGDIIVEISGGSPTQATGRSLYVTKGLLENYNNHLVCSNFCRGIVLKEKVLSAYFFFTWQLLYDNDNMFNYEGKTSGIKNLLLDVLLENYWVFPKPSLCKKFNERLSGLIDMMDVCNQEIQYLNKNRDYYLTLLLNGQIKIKD